MDRMIDMTEAEVLEANLAALGIHPDAIYACRSFEEQILEALEAAARRLKRPVRTKEILDGLSGISLTTLRYQLAQMRRDNRVFAFVDQRKRDNWVYLPKVV
jgi:hypothetical protein